MRAALVVNGAPPETPTGNALLDRMLGAELHYVSSREDRDPGMQRVARAARGLGRHPFIVPLGASTPLGALGFVRAVAELAEQIDAPPDVIFHASSSGGTQAGIVSGCRALDWPTRVIGISADEPAAALCATVQAIVDGIATLVPGLATALAAGTRIEVDDRFIGPGYGIATPESEEAQGLAAEREAIILDSTYTAKAMAGLIGHVRSGALDRCRSLLFWHTGGQPSVFA
jgi:1-aminocyclopropane-1-carboxylate deaminase/D-cysteine desulfhydrase-like pyridoxal-dependent ACC family enzyme